MRKVSMRVLILLFVMVVGNNFNMLLVYYGNIIKYFLFMFV